MWEHKSCPQFVVPNSLVILMDLPSDHAPGPDGYIGIFFQIAWDTMKRDVIAALHKLFLNNGRGFGRLNQALITLIPKSPEACHIQDFRPISLCNVVYKVISKMVAARLKVFLPEIISPTQSAFVPGRMITDNVLVAYECFHKIKNKRDGKEGLCAIKLDMHKAYDRLEWVFSEGDHVEIRLQLGQFYHAMCFYC